MGTIDWRPDWRERQDFRVRPHAPALFESASAMLARRSLRFSMLSAHELAANRRKGGTWAVVLPHLPYRPGPDKPTTEPLARKGVGGSLLGTNQSTVCNFRGWSVKSSHPASETGTGPPTRYWLPSPDRSGRRVVRPPHLLPDFLFDFCVAHRPPHAFGACFFGDRDRN